MEMQGLFIERVRGCRPLILGENNVKIARLGNVEPYPFKLEQFLDKTA